MSDIYKAVSTAFGVLGLKVRSAATIVDNLKSKGIELTDSGGFLSARQGSTEFNVGEMLQAYFKQNPGDFVGHAGEVNFKSDFKDDQAKVAFIRQHGYEKWAAMPYNEKSPSAVNVVKPTVVSTELTRAQWLTLTPKEKTEAISGWGNEAIGNVEAIMRRR